MALVLALGGCATLSESECQRGDWYAIGARDGRSGHTSERLSDHGKACAKHGLGVDGRAYDAGYTEGLREFCTPLRAFTLGRDGGTYYRQCPSDTEGDFLAAYDLGRDVHLAEQELAQLEQEIESLRKEIADEKTTASARDIAEQRLRYVRNDLDRRERDRDALLERARRRGYGNVW
ncbi:DUF2799 domain-containing protein [Xanthomonadaceae bacterium JHOS43]|nr:DUF2799 domain-containing protein [Xanthomonadaceae bacterium JHOS43]MCX7562267.1 DUF2799 domain-containing protein [Xanthomonadaceae bacterium XH05]